MRTIEPVIFISMKKIALALIILTSLSCFIKGATPDSSYTIADWRGFAQSAVTYTWDDNTPKQLSDALPLFDRYGFKTTFFVITTTGPNWNGLKTAQSNGHEIASHTLTHTGLNTLPDSTQEKEQRDSQAEINNRMGNKQCVTLAYPYCAPGNKSITEKYYISARGCSGQVENKTPADFMSISSIICGAQGVIKTSQDFNSKVDNGVQMNGWTIFLLHGINNDGGYSPIDSTELSKNLEYVSSNKNKFWVNTFANITRYIRERDGSVINELANTDSLITFTVAHSLDTSIYNYPITIKRAVPDGWQQFSASQDNKQIPFIVTNEKGKRFIQMDIIPNRGMILIHRGMISGIAEQNLISQLQIYPNPVQASTVIQFELKKTTAVSIELQDSFGRIIRSITSGSYAQGVHQLLLNTTGLPYSVVYVALYADGQKITKKLLIDK